MGGAGWVEKRKEKVPIPTGSGMRGKRPRTSCLYNFELHGMSVLPYLKESYSVYNSSQLQVPHVNNMVTLKNVCVVFEDCLP